MSSFSSLSAFAGRRRCLLLALFFIAFAYPTIIHWYEIHRTLSIAARPLWASAPDGGGPRQILPHYYVANAPPFANDICELHGWAPRTILESLEHEMWDAIILDGATDAEIDMLEIRLNEVEREVDKFFIVESNRTINGTPKSFFFGEQRWEPRLQPFQSKIVYRAVPAPSIDSIRSPSPEAWSARLRSEMNALLRTRSSNTRRPPLVLFSSPDEIPAVHTLRLLRDCKFPSPLHLQMRQFMYSFEFPVGWESWRAQVHVWDTGTQLESLGQGEARITRRRTEYSHERVSEFALADAGWHCTYCYKMLDDIIAKMQDDYGAEAASITPETLQDAVCEGKDLFNTLPEAYTYKEMLQLLSSEPYASHPSSSHRTSGKLKDRHLRDLSDIIRSGSVIQLPRDIVPFFKQYRHLLPGGCRRRPEGGDNQMEPRDESNEKGKGEGR